MDSDINNAALWEKVKKDSIIMDLWKEVEVQVEYWLSQEGTLSEGILDRFGFSDTIATTWIFGFNEAGNGTIRLYDCKSFFNEFGTLQYLITNKGFVEKPLRIKYLQTSGNKYN